MSSILKGLIDEGENVAVIYVDGKPAAKYTKKHEAEDDAQRIRKKFPNKKIEVKQEVREAEGDTLHDPEYALPEARRITKAIKYDDTVGDIVTQIQMLAERTEGIDSKTLEYSIDRVLSAKNSLESEVYGLEEAFEDAARNAQYKRDDVDEGNYNNNRTGFRRGPRDDERHDLDVQKPSNQVWGLKINGKVWSKDGKDVTFASKEQALKARQTLLAKRPELEIGLITKGGVAEDSLDEACWKGYHKEGNKELFGKTVPNCVKNEGLTEENKNHHFIYEGIWDNIKNIYKGLSTAKPKYVRPTQKIGELDSEFQQRVTDAWNKYQAELGNPTEEPAQFGSNEMGHGSEDNELRMFMAGQKPAAIISLGQLPKWKKLIDSRKYATAQLTQHGRPSSVIIAQPGEEHRIEKLQQLVQNAIDAGEKGDFRAYQNSNYHRWVGKLLGYSADKINSFIQHYFKDTPDLAKKPVYEEQHSESCPHCGGELVSEELMHEKQDACYRKVKSRYKVWPSAYASGALVQCRKKGASNWGNSTKNEDIMDQVDESLRDWFKEKWVRFGPDGKIRGDCARGDDSEGKPKCLPQSKAHSLGKKGRASAATRKRKEDPNPERSGKAINVNTKKKSNESMMESDSSDAVYNAVLNRIMRRHLDLLQEYGPKIVMYAIEDVANGVGDLEEIGSSDVSIWTKQVISDLQSGQYAHLKETPTGLPVEGQPSGRRIYRPKSAGTFAEDTAYAGGMGQGGNAGQSYRKFKPKSAGTFKESAIMAGLKRESK